MLSLWRRVDYVVTIIVYVLYLRLPFNGNLTLFFFFVCFNKPIWPLHVSSHSFGPSSTLLPPRRMLFVGQEMHDETQRTSVCHVQQAIRHALLAVLGL